MLTSQMVCAVPNGEACLLTNETEGLLVDAGYDYGSPALAGKVKAILGDRPLTAILVTHSHYDHVSGCPAVKEIYPDTPIVASQLTAQLLAKEKVLQTIRHLNQAVADGRPYPDHTGELTVDSALSHREDIRLGGFEITAIETPGHTRCCMSFYIHGEDLLVCSESTGVWVDGKLVPGFVASYPMALASIKDCAGMNAGRVIVPHYGELGGKAAEDFFTHAAQVARQAAGFVFACHERGLDQQATVQAFIRQYYGENHSLPREAVALNTTAMVAKLLDQNRESPNATGML